MDDAVSYCLALFICGGPCHLSSFTVLGTLFSADSSLFIQFWDCMIIYLIL